jgi:16S rRNA (uracil1498-N3)-methyltransferase
MSNRFYIDPVVSIFDIDVGRVVLCGDEAYHFCRVMRGAVGDEIFVFDGVGGLFRGVVESIFKDKVEVRLIERIDEPIESPLRLTIAGALPKGDRQKFLIEKLAELGVYCFVPVCFERSVARADVGVIKRFKRYVIEAAKQCGRNKLMEITEETSLENFIKYTQNAAKEINVAQNKEQNNKQVNKVNEVAGVAGVAESNFIRRFDFLRLILHPVSLGLVGQITPQQLLGGGLSCNITALIGPEGSFTDREISSCIESGFVPLAMGARILRTETAAIAVAALLLPYAG